MISPPISEFLRNLRTQDVTGASLDDAGEAIRVHGVTSRLGGFYERLRYLIDYKEEHTIRRSAIERMLKRKLVFDHRKEMGHSLVKELISGGYLPNNSVSEKTALDVQHIIDAYAGLEQVVQSRSVDPGVVAPITSLMASEVEALWYTAPIDELVAKAFYESVQPHITCDVPFPEAEFNTQIYIACRRTLLRNDDQAIQYVFWRDAVPEWRSEKSMDDMSACADRYISFAAAMRVELDHPLGNLLSAKLRNHAIYFRTIKEIAETQGIAAMRILEDPKLLDREVEKLLEPKYKKVGERARQSGIRAVAYVMATKMILAIAGELPYEFFILHAVNYPALGINVVFHPVLLLVITRSIAPLGAKNTQYILDGMHEVLYDQNRQIIRIKTKKLTGALAACFAICYGIFVLVIFGLILWLLHRLYFNVVSMALFLFFLTLVSYVGLRIRYSAQVWSVRRSEEEGGFSLLWGLITLPIVRVGRWMSKTFSSINIFIFIMDFMIETPFKLLLSVFDAFISFLKEKKEETY